jgi:hypothetical protein
LNIIGTSIVYFLKALLFGLAAVIFIPKEKYKKYFIYGFILGGVIDVILIVTLSYLDVIKYYNMGPFSVFNIFPFFTPIAWTFAMMLFLHFLPIRKVFLYPYVISFALYGVALGQVLKGFGLFRYNIFIMPFVYIFWFSLAAIVYIHNERLTIL